MMHRAFMLCYGWVVCQDSNTHPNMPQLTPNVASNVQLHQRCLKVSRSGPHGRADSGGGVSASHVQPLPGKQQPRRVCTPPHGGVRPFYQKSSCITQLTSQASCGANLVTLRSIFRPNETCIPHESTSANRIHASVNVCSNSPLFGHIIVRSRHCYVTKC
jgi:hypothetical protein